MLLLQHICYSKWITETLCIHYSKKFINTLQIVCSTKGLGNSYGKTLSISPLWHHVSKGWKACNIPCVVYWPNISITFLKKAHIWHLKIISHSLAKIKLLHISLTFTTWSTCKVCQVNCFGHVTICGMYLSTSDVKKFFYKHTGNNEFN